MVLRRGKVMVLVKDCQMFLTFSPSELELNVLSNCFTLLVFSMQHLLICQQFCGYFIIN